MTREKGREKLIQRREKVTEKLEFGIGEKKGVDRRHSQGTAGGKVSVVQQRGEADDFSTGRKKGGEEGGEFD